MNKIYYRELHQYKYQLARTYMFQLPHNTEASDWPIVSTEFISINNIRLLIIKKGYAWDGPSGPTIDTKDSMRGALIHDALYQLIRLGKLNQAYKATADKIFYNVCIDDGMWDVRAKVWYAAVSKLADFATKPKEDGEWPVLSAP